MITNPALPKFDRASSKRFEVVEPAELLERGKKTKYKLNCRSLQKQIQHANTLICTCRGWQLLQTVAPLVCHLRDALWWVKNRTLLMQQLLSWKLRQRETVVELPSWASPTM